MVPLLIFSALLVVLYVGAAIGAKRELPESISSLVYLLPREGQWVWIVWMWLVTFSLTPALMESLPETWRFVGFLTVACLAFCGAMPVRMKESNTAHNVLGVSAGILSQACVAVIDTEWLAVWMLWVFLAGSAYIQPGGWLGKAVKGRLCFLAEAVCWIGLMCVLFIH